MEQQETIAVTTDFEQPGSEQTLVERLVSRDLGDGFEPMPAIELRHGMAWVLYIDDGPSGAGGQSVRDTCPRCSFSLWPNEDQMRASIESAPPKGKNMRIMSGVIGEYTAGGIARICVHG